MQCLWCLPMVRRLTLIVACMLLASPALGARVVIKDGPALNLSGGLDPTLADLTAGDIVHVTVDDTAFSDNLASNTRYGDSAVFSQTLDDMLFKFDLSALPGFAGGTVHVAQLRIRQSGGNGGGPSCGRVLYHDWTEALARRFDPLGTNNLRWGPSSNAKFSATGDVGPLAAMTFVDEPATFEDWFVADVTADAQAMASGTVPNHGWYVYGGGNRSYFASETDRDGDRPALFLIYTPAGATNAAPIVDAGPNQAVNLPADADLSGSVIDDDLPYPPGALTYTWSKDSGPGAVTFGNASARRTPARFSVDGTYVLRLTAHDGSLSGSDTLIITVAPVPTNAPPVVNAGPDHAVTLPAGIVLDGSATDDGVPSCPGAFTHTWTKDSGPGTVIFGAVASAGTTAAFSVPGTYVLRLTAHDGHLSGSDMVTITVASGTPGIRIVGTGATYSTVQAAVNAAVDGDTIEISSGTYYREACLANIKRNNLTIRGVGPTRPVLDAYYDACLSKGIFVIDGTNTTLENLEFYRCRSYWADNAAGIRQQAAHLTVRNCCFRENDNGILENSIAGSNILIEHSEFDRNGYGGGQTHNMYIGRVGSFTLRYCYSHDAVDGHEVKTRGQTNYILYNRLGNEGGTGSYEVNVPNGGTTYIIGNQIEQSAQGYYVGNPAMIAFAEEGATNADQHLYVLNNTLVSNRTSSAAIFVRNSSTTTALVQNNIFQGTGTAVQGPANAIGNWATANAALAWAPQYDFRLTAGSTGAINAGSVPDPAVGIDGFSLLAVSQYVHPCSYGDRLTSVAMDLGAYEYVSAPDNQPPCVEAGVDQVTTVPRYTVNLDGAVDDDGLPNPPALAVIWSQISGPGTVTFGDADTVHTTAAFSDVGTYVLRLEATDGLLSSSDTMTVTVKPDPQRGATITFQNGVSPDVTYAGCESTHLNETNATYNYGGQGGVIGTYAGTNRSLVKFAVGAIPKGATIRSARLRLRASLTGTNGVTLEAFRALQPWTRYGASWNNYVAGLAWSSPGCSGAGTDRASAASGGVVVAGNWVVPVWVELPLDKMLVQGWVNGSVANNGIVLQAEGSGQMHYHGERDSVLANRPELIVDYSVRMPGDINGDGKVNVFDLQRIGASWNKQVGQAGYDAACDLNGDNKVNVFDLQILGANWNT